MMLANVNSVKRAPQRRERGTCPGCGHEVIAKCGKVVVHHWAHKSLVECDSWYEPETAWHHGWKTRIGQTPDRIEVTIKDSVTGKWHRADAMSPDGYVVELQHSRISQSDVDAREDFYGRLTKGMIWLLDGLDKGAVLKSPVFVHRGDEVHALANAGGSTFNVGTWSESDFVEACQDVANLLGGCAVLLDVQVEEHERKIAAEAARRARHEAILMDRILSEAVEVESYLRTHHVLPVKATHAGAIRGSMVRAREDFLNAVDQLCDEVNTERVDPEIEAMGILGFFV